MMQEILKDAADRMDKSIEALRQELSKIRTGKATTALLDGVKVEYYGTMTPLNQTANVSVLDPHTLSVQPWDKNALGAIDKAIKAADLGLNPSNDGVIIRVPIPALNEERRREFVKLVKRFGEETKIALRNVRRDANDHLKKAEKEDHVSEDARQKAEKDVQEMTDKHVARVDELLKHKEAEIMEVCTSIASIVKTPRWLIPVGRLRLRSVQCVRSSTCAPASRSGRAWATAHGSTSRVNCRRIWEVRSACAPSARNWSVENRVSGLLTLPQVSVGASTRPISIPSNRNASATRYTPSRLQTRISGTACAAPEGKWQMMESQIPYARTTGGSDRVKSANCASKSSRVMSIQRPRSTPRFSSGCTGSTSALADASCRAVLSALSDGASRSHEPQEAHPRNRRKVIAAARPLPDSLRAFIFSWPRTRVPRHP